jgi:transaldolase
MPSNLESLREYSLVVADSGDIEAVARWKPQDATTNPSLLLASAEDPRFRHLIELGEGAWSRDEGDSGGGEEGLREPLGGCRGFHVLCVERGVRA